jgi:hypothetical protein
MVVLITSQASDLSAGQAIVQMARSRVNGLEYAIKFFISKGAFEAERDLYTNPGKPFGPFLPQARCPSYI